MYAHLISSVIFALRTGYILRYVRNLLQVQFEKKGIKIDFSRLAKVKIYYLTITNLENRSKENINIITHVWILIK